MSTAKKASKGMTDKQKIKVADDLIAAGINPRKVVGLVKLLKTIPAGIDALPSSPKADKLAEKVEAKLADAALAEEDDE